MKLTFLAMGIFLSTFAFAQLKDETNGKSGQSFYAELGGPGILFSANYDRRFTKSNLGFGGRIGLGFVTGYEYDTTSTPFGNPYYYGERQRSVLTVPVQVNYLFGKPSSVSSFEVGLGVTFTGKKLNIFDNYYGNPNDASSIYGTASFMYRRMPKGGGFSWRAGFTPIITKGYIQPSGGVSIGYNF